MKTPIFIAKVYHRIFARELMRFALIGFFGFVVNYAVLLVLFHLLKLPILLSQIIGAEIALLTTFTGNNFWAFRGHHHISIKKKIIKYHLTSGAAVCITTLLVVIQVKYLHLYYGLALVFAACVGLLWNYLFNKNVVFQLLKSEQ
jgi:putative flippase GtrA